MTDPQYTILSMLGFYNNIKDHQIFLVTAFWQKVQLLSNCLVTQESQFDDLCELWQIAISWAICLYLFTLVGVEN
jgi:hypothetical protein